MDDVDILLRLRGYSVKITDETVGPGNVGGLELKVFFDESA